MNRLRTRQELALDVADQFNKYLDTPNDPIVWGKYSRLPRYWKQ